MNKKQFIAEKLNNFKQFLLDNCTDEKILLDINRLSEQSIEAVIIYFHGLAQQGCTPDIYMNTIMKHIKLDNYTDEQLGKLKAYIGLFLDVCK